MILALALTVIVACGKEDTDTDCIQTAENPEWITEDFKPVTHTIQFPDDYSGVGLTGFEGPIFFKFNQDSSVFFSYSFCGPLFCEDYGASFDPAFKERDEIEVDDKWGNPLTLGEKQEFCSSEDKITGILFHNEDTSATGYFYMNRDTSWNEALWIEFERGYLDEVKDILATVTEK